MVGLYLSLTLRHVQEIFLITGLLFLSIPVYSIREGLIYVGGRPTNLFRSKPPAILRHALLLSAILGGLLRDSVRLTLRRKGGAIANVPQQTFLT